MGNVTSIAGRRNNRNAGWVSAKQEKNLKIYLLGRMRVIARDGQNVLPRARKARALLAYLCLTRNERVFRSRLAALLWDRSGEEQARMSLRHALSELTVLNSGAPGLIALDREAVRLDASACWIDVFAGLADPERLLDNLDGVSDSFDHWLAGERARFEDQVRATLEKGLNQLIDENASPNLRAGAARKLINFDPTHEGAVRSLMIAFAQMGDRVQAIREYERCRLALRTTLDAVPSSETVALYEAVRLLSQARPGDQERRRQGETREGEPKPQPVPVTTRRNATEGQGQVPSIAVLPFRNLSAEACHSYVADGLVEDLIEALSRVPGLFVISRLSTLAFRNEDRLPKEIGELLGVRYVLSGSMRIVEDRLRLTVELTDTQKAIVLWFSKLNEQFFDLLEVQDRLAEAIVGRVAPYLHAAELNRARLKRPEGSEAHDLFLRAQENMHNSSRTVFASSEALFEEAINRNPEYARVLAWKAYWHVLRVGQGWSPNPAHDTKLADHFAQRAVDCDMLEPMAFAVKGHIASYLHKNFELAFQHFDAALRVNPNAAPAWLWSAAAHSWLGHGARAVEEINRAIALSPYDPLMYAFTAVAGMAYLADAQYERAIECGLRSLGQNRTFTATYKLLVLALMLANRESEARVYLGQLLTLQPDLTVAEYRRRFPGSAGPIGEFYCDTLARAGLPLIG